jgi:hypothetical protein
MAINNRTRSSRPSARRGAGATTRAAGKARAGRGSTRSAARGDGRAKVAEAKAREAEGARGSRRTCEAPGCGKGFRAYVARQRFCSNGCRSRAFYWDFKDRTGERYAAHLSAVEVAPRKPVRRRRGARSA